MEQFKVCEKDTKTKAYSREGLAREARNDPRDAEKEEKRQWVNDCLTSLQDLVESIEADIDKASASNRGKIKNKDAVRFRRNHPYENTVVLFSNICYFKYECLD